MNKLPFSGDSMKPLLESGDEVLFCEINSVPIKGDVVLFRDPINREMIVHRVFSIDPLETKGDWSCSSEQIPLENVFGKVHGLKRNGITYEFSTNPIITNLILILSKALLNKASTVRKLSRVGLLSLSFFMRRQL